jgi:hypothetical protein
VEQIDAEIDDVPFRDGVFVRALGRPLSGNPYSQGSKDAARWESGWRLIDAHRPTSISTFLSPFAIEDNAYDYVYAATASRMELGLIAVFVAACSFLLIGYLMTLR